MLTQLMQDNLMSRMKKYTTSKVDRFAFWKTRLPQTLRPSQARPNEIKPSQTVFQLLKLVACRERMSNEEARGAKVNQQKKPSSKQPLSDLLIKEGKNARVQVSHRDRHRHVNVRGIVVLSSFSCMISFPPTGDIDDESLARAITLTQRCDDESSNCPLNALSTTNGSLIQLYATEIQGCQRRDS